MVQTGGPRYGERKIPRVHKTISLTKQSNTGGKTNQANEEKKVEAKVKAQKYRLVIHRRQTDSKLEHGLQTGSRGRV